jgi:hypothetical protein
MDGDGLLKCEFRLLRYVPDVVRNEYVHIGVILSSKDGNEPPLVQVTRDWRRVRCLDPSADTEMLEAIANDLQQQMAEMHGDEVIRLLEDSFSLALQTTAPKAHLTKSLPVGMEELMRLYVDPPKREQHAGRLSGRSAIHAKMRMEFERVGAWDLMRKRIAVSEYTQPGDPLRIDAAYRPNGVIRMFHAVGLEADLEMAKVLAFSAADLRLGVERIEHANLELNAVVDPAVESGATYGDPVMLQRYQFAVETMEKHQIRVVTIADLGMAAEIARRDLHI